MKPRLVYKLYLRFHTDIIKETVIPSLSATKGIQSGQRFVLFVLVMFAFLLLLLLLWLLTS